MFWLAIKVVINATPNEPPSCLIIPVKAAPCPICWPFRVDRERVVIGMNSIPNPNPRNISIQKNASLPVSGVKTLYPQKLYRKKISMPSATRYCCFTPLCNICPIIGIINAVVNAAGTISRPACSAVQPNVLCVYSGIMNVEP